jgi:hypothetical protein
MVYTGGNDPQFQQPGYRLVTPCDVVNPFASPQPWPIVQPTMLGDGTVTATLKRSFFHIALDLVLIAVGVSLIRSSRERRRQAAATPPATHLLHVEPPSSAYALYEVGVETALRVVQLVVMSEVAVSPSELASLRALGTTLERYLHAERSTWPGRSRSGEAVAWFIRAEFTLLQRALNSLNHPSIIVTYPEAKRFALLLDLVSLSLSSSR